jgi:predicted N-formylglutamate amidohydrolase
MADGDRDPVVIENPDGKGPFAIVCDHASRYLPDRYGLLGLPADALATHIAWDPGGLALARHLSHRLDATLLWPDISRLVIDCNRPPDAPDLIAAVSEGRQVPGNQTVAEAERSYRLAAFHAPYHEAIEACLERRAAANLATTFVAVHSFTQVYLGESRPWEIGVVFDDDRRIADMMLAALGKDPALTIGVNQPYSPADRGYYTVNRHARSRGLPAVMIEIRNDQIADQFGQRRWGEKLGDIFEALIPTIAGDGYAAA